MQINLQSVIMALALLIATVLTMLIEKLRKENKRDHGYVRSRLDDIHQDVKEVNTRLNNHIEWHMDANQGAPAPRRPRKRPSKAV